MKSSHAAVKLSRWGSVHSAPDKSPSPNREQHNKSHFYRRFYAARSKFLPKGDGDCRCNEF